VSKFLSHALVGLFALASFQEVHAIAVQCVSTPTQLQTALTTAENDNQPNYIALVTGTYTLTGSLQASINDNLSVLIEGGYSAGCGSLPVATPDQTIITGANVAGTGVQIFTSGGDLTIRNLTFTALKPAVNSSAVYISDYNAGDHLTIQNVAIHHNNVQGINDNILAVYPGGGLSMIDDVVHDNGNAAATVYIYSNYPGSPLVIANNTIANNVSTGLSMNLSGVDIPVGVFNNILWNNSLGDFRLLSSRVMAFNNTWQTQLFDASSGLTPESANNDNKNPHLLANLQLDQTTSPAVNSGLPLPLQLPQTDAGENPRVSGSAPDRGAYETSVSDQAYFLVNNATDKTHLDDSTITCAPSKPCTLREAINKANTFGPSHIAFHLAGTCGAAPVISLTSPLPPVAVPMFIDGYSEPGASASTIGGSNGIVESNAVICVTIFGLSSIANAFSVADSAPSTTHLEISGVAIYDFVTGVDLAGGNGNWIHGNHLYGPFFAGPLGNGVGVTIEGGAANVIGGKLDVDSNFLSSSTGTAGIVVKSTSTIYNTIYGNSIGGDPSGLTPSYGNTGHGVVVNNTYSTFVQKNWIVSNGGDGIRLDGAVNALVQSNTIGSSLVATAGNGGAGVRAVGNAYDNWIGYTDVQGYGGGNAIVNNALAGVLIDIDAGRNNQTVGNYIQGNGGLAIDLAFVGPTANAGTENTGPNYLLHKPILTSANAAKVGPTVNVAGTINTSAHDVRYVSIYSNYACGDANFLLNTFQLTADANGLIKFNVSVPAASFEPAYITATASDNTSGATSTSEISNCKTVSSYDDIFNDGFNAY
jgi:trimeric autotransporter adhesin